MKTIYHIYEGIAVLLIIMCWWSLAFQAQQLPHNYLAPEQASLDNAVQRAYQDNQLTAQRIYRWIPKTGASQEGLNHYKRINSLQKQSNALIFEIESLKTQIRKLPPDAQALVKVLMIDQKKGDSLQYRLNNYVDWLSREFKDLELPNFDKLAEGTASNPLFKHERKNDFSHHYFEKTTPLMANLTLTYLQTRVKRYEKETLKRMTAGDITYAYPFPHTSAYVTPSVNTLQVGDNLTADMFVGIQPIWINAKMYYNDVFVPDYFSESKTTFQAQGKGRQAWQGKFKYQHQGRDTVVTHNIPYTIYPRKKQPRSNPKKQ